MPNTVVLLTSDDACDQAAMIAKAILGGCQQVQVYLFNYRARTLHRADAPNTRTEALRTANLGVIQPSAKKDCDPWRDAARYLEINGVNVPNQPLTQGQLGKLAQFASEKLGMTTLAVAKIDKYWSGQWISDATQLLEAVAAAIPQRGTVCWMIAPNARNGPVRLQTFGHKLSWDGTHGRVQYQKSSGATYSVAHLTETQFNAVASLTEIILCRAIIKSGTMRFLGNCYGAQIMWLSLGGGLTSFKRNNGIPRGNTLVVPTGGGAQDPTLNVDWDHGVSVGDREEGEPVTDTAQLQSYQGVTFNTDYHHSCLMILSAELHKVDDGVKNSFERHQLADLITSDDVDDQFQNTNEFLKRLRAYAYEKRWDLARAGTKQASWQQKQRRVWGWIGEYHFDSGRISGFQGHPLLHLDIVHPNQGDTQQYMEEQMFGT
jgi:hypothetical protein